MIPGCGLPSCSLYSPEEPTVFLDEFFTAIREDDEDKANELLIGSDWSAGVDGEMTASDRELASALTQSRCYEIKDLDFIDGSRRTASVTIWLTTFDMALFEKALTDSVEEDVKRQLYEGKDKSDFSETQGIIDRHTRELLDSPQQFYSTCEQTFEMRLDKSTWRIVMTDGFYQALLGMR